MGVFPPEGGLKRVGERFAGGLVLIIGALLMIVTRELDKGVGDRENETKETFVTTPFSP